MGLWSMVYGSTYGSMVIIHHSLICQCWDRLWTLILRIKSIAALEVLTETGNQSVHHKQGCHLGEYEYFRGILAQNICTTSDQRRRRWSDVRCTNVLQIAMRDGRR